MKPRLMNPIIIIAQVDGSGIALILATLTLSITKSAAVLPPPKKFRARLKLGAVLAVNVVL